MFLYHLIISNYVIICYYILHQKSPKLLKIPENKMHRSYENYGNTVSSTIPIGLKQVLLKALYYLVRIPASLIMTFE